MILTILQGILFGFYFLLGAILYAMRMRPHTIVCHRHALRFLAQVEEEEEEEEKTLFQ